DKNHHHTSVHHHNHMNTLAASRSNSDYRPSTAQQWPPTTKVPPQLELPPPLQPLEEEQSQKPPCTHNLIDPHT
ncbi:hypothetical protein Dimus_020829, partial [Dionaea muscipula]